MQSGYWAYRCRLYPNARQAAYFHLMFKACRAVYNHFLDVRMAAYRAKKSDPSVRVPTRFDMCKMLTTFKQTDLDPAGRPWLKDVDSTALVYELQHLDDAFTRFFRRARRKDASPGFPKPKWAGDRDSATIAFKKPEFVERNRIRFAKIGWVNAKCWRELEGVPVSCTVSVDAAGRWWASILCRDVPASVAPEPAGEECVVRLGGGASVGEGRTERNEREERAKRKRRREERKLARREGSIRKGPKTSNRYKKQDQKVAKLRAQESDGIRTRAQQEAAAIAKSAARIVVEGTPTTPEEQALLSALKTKCTEWHRDLIHRE